MKIPEYSVQISDRNTGDVVGTAIFTVVSPPILLNFDNVSEQVMANFRNDNSINIPKEADLYFSSEPVVCNT